MLSAAARGAGYVLAGLRRLGDPRLRLFVIVPFLINVLIFGLAIWWTAGVFEDWMAWLVGWLPDWLDWLRWLIWPVFALAVVLTVFFSFTILANVVGAPFNGLLAEKVERIERPGGPAVVGRPLWLEVPYAIGHEFRKWAYFLPRAVPLLLLFLIPGVNALAPILWFAFGAWMLALEYADYPMGNHGLVFGRQRALLGERRMMTLGFGAGVLVMTLVPVLNFLSMPTAVIGATLMWTEQFRDADGQLS